MPPVKPMTPREFMVPTALCSASFGPKTTLDEMELVSARATPAGRWAKQVLQRENTKTLDRLLGDDIRLPRGILDSTVEEEVVVALLNHRGEVWQGRDWERPSGPIAASGTLDLDEADVAFVARAFWEGSDAVVMRAYVPNAFLHLNGIVAAGVGDTDPDFPEGGVAAAIVDPIDRNAVLEAIVIAPGPVVYRRNDGRWEQDPAWVDVLRSVHPPTIVKLDQAKIAAVIAQVDEATSGVKFEPFEAENRSRYIPIQASSYIAELRQEADDRAIALTLGMLAVAGKELSPKDFANTEKLRRYWLYGKGAAKIRWFTPGAWRRCYRNLVKYLGPKMTPGYCTNLSKRLGGPGVATHVGDRKRG